MSTRPDLTHQIRRSVDGCASGGRPPRTGTGGGAGTAAGSPPEASDRDGRGCQVTGGVSSQAGQLAGLVGCRPRIGLDQSGQVERAWMAITCRCIQARTCVIEPLWRLV